MENTSMPNENINVSGKLQHQLGGNPGDLVIGQRLERIEKRLDGIYLKLDEKASKQDLERVALMKANRDDLLRIEDRLRDVERGESPASRMFFERYHHLEEAVEDLTRHGSAHAQDLAVEMKRIEADTKRMEEVIDTLREDSIRMSGVSQERVNDATSRVRFWTMAISAMNVALIMINVVVSVIVGLHL